RLDAVAKALGLTGEPGAGPTLARVFETMPPEDAAAILERLDDATVRVILARMRERPLGAVLAAMPRDRAAALTKALAAPAVVATAGTCRGPFRRPCAYAPARPTSRPDAAVFRRARLPHGRDGLEAAVLHGAHGGGDPAGDDAGGDRCVPARATHRRAR